MNRLEEMLRKVGTTQMAVVAFIVRDNKLLIGLRNYTKDKWKEISVWTGPGGRCDKGDTFEQTLLRETKEEVGITDLKITEYLGTVPGAKEGDILYVFKGITNQKPKLMEPEKFSEWKWCPLNQIPENFINSKSLSLLL